MKIISFIAQMILFLKQGLQAMIWNHHRFAVVVFFVALAFSAKTQDYATLPTDSIVSHWKALEPLQKEVAAENITKILSEHDQTDSLAIVLYWVGRQYLIDKNTGQAEKYTRQSVQAFESAANPDELLFDRALNNLAVNFKNRGLFKKAIPYFNQIIDRGKTPYLMGLAYKELGKIYNQQGDFIRAAEVLEQAEKQLVGNERASRYKDINLELGNSYYKQGNVEQAEAAFDREAAFLNSSAFDNNEYGRIYNLAQLYRNRGILASDALRSSEAVSNYNRALTFLDQLDEVEEDVLSLKNLLALEYTETGNAARARPLFDQIFASPMFAEFSEATGVYTNYAEYLLLVGEEKAARSAASKALQTYPGRTSQQILPETTELTTLPDKIYLLETLKTFAATQTDSDPETLLEVYKTMDSLIDIMRSEDQESKEYWRSTVKPIYDEATGLAIKHNLNQQALYFFEKAKAILLLDGLNQNNVVTEMGQNPLFIQEDSLRTALTGLELEAESEDRNTAIIALKSQLDLLQNDIEAAYPEYVAIAYKTEVLNLESLQSMLQENMMVVHFLMSDSLLQRLVISNNEVTSTSIMFGKEEMEIIRKVIEAAKGPFSTKTEAADYLKLSNQAYELVLGSLPANKNVVILPDGILNYLSFETLSTSATEYQPLILDHLITYGFSASTMFTERPQRQKGKTLAFAPIEYAVQELPELPFSELELRALKPFRGKSLVRKKANKVNLMRAFGENRILHISSHAAAGDTSFTFPWIATSEDRLFLPEIYNQRSKAELVVLSACETTLGKEVKGEGVISLARGFFHAGAESVIASLWQVNDKSTAQIINSFYGNVRKGETKASALRQAKLDFMETNPTEAQSPYYWAGMVYIGQDADLKIKRKAPLWVWFAGIGLLAFIGFFSRRRSLPPA